MFGNDNICECKKGPKHAFPIQTSFFSLFKPNRSNLYDIFNIYFLVKYVSSFFWPNNYNLWAKSLTRWAIQRLLPASTIQISDLEKGKGWDEVMCIMSFLKELFHILRNVFIPFLLKVGGVDWYHSYFKHELTAITLT